MIGRVVKGLYKIYDKIATGGFASVYVGRNTFTNEIVAIKVLSEQYTREERYVERFRREAIMAERLRHPNIVRVLDHGVEDDKHFLVMEFVEGLSLETLIERKGALSIDEVVSYTRQACAGMQMAESAGIVHRDIKPANLMITPDGTLKIMDFGIARVESLAGLTQSGMFMGTPRYISPEIAQGARADIRSDLYSLGLVMYEMLTGAPPFDASSPWAVVNQQIKADPPPIETIRGDVPQWLRDAVMRLLAKNPDDRFQTPGALNAVLESRGVGVEVPARPYTPPATLSIPTVTPPEVSITDDRGDRGTSRRLIIALAATAVVVIAALGAAFALGLFDGGGKSASVPTIVVTNTPTEATAPGVTMVVVQPAATDTSTPTEQVRDTETPTSTPTEPPTVAPTEPPTQVPATPTDTPTQEPTATETPTAEPTATDTPTIEPTATNTPRPRPTNTPAPTDTATSPPAPLAQGRTAFSSGGSIYVVKADTGNVVLGPIPNMRQPDFEPGGQTILANGQGGGTDSLWTINAGGGLDREQSEHPDDFRPFFNPSNPARFVFDSTRLPSGSPSLFVGNLNSRGEPRDPMNYGGGPIVGSHPVWLGNDMVLYAGCDYGFGSGSNCGLFRVPSWGGVPARILAGSRNELPADGYGTQALITSQRDGNWEVYLINADGSGLRNLSSNAGSQDGPSTFSPDGHSWPLSPTVGGPGRCGSSGKTGRG